MRDSKSLFGELQKTLAGKPISDDDRRKWPRVANDAILRVGTETFKVLDVSYGGVRVDGTAAGVVSGDACDAEIFFRGETGIFSHSLRLRKVSAPTEVQARFEFLVIGPQMLRKRD